MSQRPLAICPVLSRPRRRITTATASIRTDSLLLEEILPQVRKTLLTAGASGAIRCVEKVMVLM